MKKSLAIFLTFLISTSLIAKVKDHSSTDKVDLKIEYCSIPDILVTFTYVEVDKHRDIIVHLSDGSKWEIKGFDKEKAYHEILQNWNQFDDIRIGVNKEDKSEFIIKNMSTKTAYLVDGVFDKYMGIPMKNVDQNGYVFVLNDNQLWQAGYLGSFTTTSWKKNQRVIINKSTYANSLDYLIINTSTGTHIWASMIKWK